MITTVRTVHSVYEVDLEGRRARRVSSDHAPTPNQQRWADDGQWCDFLSVSWVHGGLLFVWHVEDCTDGETVVRRTLTSPVTEVTGSPPQRRRFTTRVWSASGSGAFEHVRQAHPEHRS